MESIYPGGLSEAQVITRTGPAGETMDSMRSSLGDLRRCPQQQTSYPHAGDGPDAVGIAGIDRESNGTERQGAVAQFDSIQQELTAALGSHARHQFLGQADYIQHPAEEETVQAIPTERSAVNRARSTGPGTCSSAIDESAG